MQKITGRDSTGHKRKTKESLPPLMDEEGELVVADTEKAEILNRFFATVFTGKCSTPIAQVPEDKGSGTGRMKNCRRRSGLRPSKEPKVC